MRKYLVLELVFMVLALAAPDLWADAAPVRRMAVAGQFYPADADTLSKAVGIYLKNAIPAGSEKPIAIVSPHAGYVYSGQICADAFKQAAGHPYDLIVLLGASHTSSGFGASVYPSGAYETPLGPVVIDKDAAAVLLASDPEIVFKETAHDREHSLEVMLPFVKTLFPNAMILPILMGTKDPDFCVRLGKILAEAVKDRKALIVVSTDLSHYPGYEDAVKSDRSILEAMTSLDSEKFQSAVSRQEKMRIPNLSTCACGESAVIAAMTASKILGANCGRIVSYANSGDGAVGDRERVVGYGAVVFIKSASCAGQVSHAFETDCPKDAALTPEGKKSLLAFARQTLEQFLDTRTIPLARGFDPSLQCRQGAFVTLKLKGQLRGCIGHMAGDRPLCQAVGAMALQAGFNDPRFRPISRNELADIEIEISVLTPFQEVDGPEKITVGRDGVLIKKQGASAVFLPQVAPEQGWNRDEMLSHLCRKAGLPEDGWKEDTRFYTFQALVFSESGHDTSQ